MIVRYTPSWPTTQMSMTPLYDEATEHETELMIRQCLQTTANNYISSC